ncbi:hypothetical protein SPI_08603 [Niveomyces insectorum RCEF 264]|uniref:Uncharacterized protein n=1 Tax=Niveomyces insectorum RCEF 264 TaxID=1081102 RepID=A0A167MTG3_9HYPO|nr:hypothetical protein SPI_08603 [Niveomyces insectorum RCEF 264]
MPGLIPLMLNPVAAGNRSSVVFSPSTKRHSRGQSISYLPPTTTDYSPNSPPSSNFAPTSSALPQRASLPTPPKPKAVKRLSFALPPTLPVLPYSAADWKRTVAEVKRQHINRRYRACFTRCNEVLDNIKDMSDVEPAYLISLHFYAATSMEMCARPLAASSSYRNSLLRQAQSHYDRAAALIRTAEELANPKIRTSLTLSASSSLHSPCESVSSRTWTSETDLTSPTPSVCSSEDLNARLNWSQSPTNPNSASPPRPARKKVSFELPKECPPPKWEPYVRPDSPTLGFDDEYFTRALSRQSLPEIPVRPKTPDVNPVRLTGEEEEEEEEEEETTPKAFKSQFFSRAMFDVHSDHIRHSFLLGRTASRYCAHLTGLKSQLALHRANVDALLQAPADYGEEASVRAPTPVDEETYALERKARIARLRESGWQRKRFDPSRYEALRTAALAELS